MKILVVDDDDLVRELILHSIGQLGHDLHSADSGETALEQIKAGLDVDLVISDWMMPGMTGVDLCAEVRRKTRRRHIFFLLLTARESREDYLSAMEAGADDFLVKPFDPEMLAAKVRAAERIFGLQTQLALSNTQLTQSNQELDDALRKMKNDIHAAAKLQLGLLPPEKVRFGRFRMSAALLPSSAVSGDIYNYFNLGDETFGLYSLDVAGHGARAAMMSFAISRFIIDLGVVGNFQQTRSLSSYVQELNEIFQSSPPDNDYFTMLLATISSDEKMRVCQAGHPHPIATPIDGGPPFPLGKGGFPVGLQEGISYEEFLVDLTQIHRVVFYTDGITECSGPNGELFGVERFQALLHEAEGKPLDDVVPAVKQAMISWHGGDEFDDDISIIVLENCEATPEAP
ncbi:response regulator receiver protein [Rhodovulum sulfidophilum]|uniref:Response regulator receiver protein n=1 Tax=Rhodovulum sulfidophilum TaxID=35806 RepID=A0A0D6B6D0_RHOSU|nr:response regulator receiver protein [Rhodovulum sulfidophilum]